MACEGTMISTRLTYSRYRQLPDDDPFEHEMIEGEEFTVPAPSVDHQWLRDQLAFAMQAFCRERRLGWVASPVDLYCDEENYVNSDISYFTPEQVRQVRGTQQIRIPPPLVVETLSPSSVHWDRVNKLGFYQRFGVQEYWIVDPMASTIEVVDLTTGQATLADPACSRVLEGFCVAWAALFE